MTKRPKHTAAEEVGSEELKEAILKMIVERFGDRKITWETAERALSLAAFEIKQAALFAPRELKS